MSAMIPAWVNPALSALLNGCYQGLLLVGLLWLMWPRLRRVNAATRYWLWWGALIITAALPLCHLVLTRPSSPPPVATRAVEAEEPAGAVSGPLADPAGTARPERASAEPVAIEEFAAPESESIETEAARPSEPMPASGADLWRRGVAWFRAVSWVQPVWQSVWPPWTSAALLAAWALVVAVRLLRLVMSCLALTRLQRRARPAGQEMQSRFATICAASSVRRPVELRLSSALGSPIASGFFRPAVLLPAGLATAMDEARFEQVVRHELAHLRRGDDWTNLVQQLIKGFLFFHPGVRWLSRRLDNDREVACDDHVLAVTPRRESYALFLTELAGRDGGRSSALAPAAWTSKTQIEERINMILDKSRDTSTRPARAKASALTFTLLLVAAGVLHLGPRLALAQEAPVAPVPPEAPAALPSAPPAPPAAPAASPRPPRATASASGASVSIGLAGSDAEEPSGAQNKFISKGRSIVIRKSGEGGASLAEIHVGSSEDASAQAENDATPGPDRTVRKSERTHEEGSTEDRLARLEKLVQSLLARKEDEQKREANRRRIFEEHSMKILPPGLGEPRATPSLEKNRKPGARFDYELKWEIDAETRAGLDHARQELAARRSQLQAELEAVRRSLEKIEEEMRNLPKTPEPPKK